MNASEVEHQRIPARGGRDTRVVLLDAASEMRWRAEAAHRHVITLKAGVWDEAERWLTAWWGSAAGKLACAEWAARSMAIEPEEAFSVSGGLTGEFRERLASGLAMKEASKEAMASAAEICAQVLGWRGERTWRPGEQWAGIGEIIPRESRPAFLLDGREDFRAALEDGDLLAGCGLDVGARVEPGAWKEFLAHGAWDRCATRWRMARALGGEDRKPIDIPSEAAKRFVSGTAPEALGMLERAEELIARERTGDEMSGEARSAAEAFLFAVLNARALTRGRFALNTALGFSFGPKPAEADLAAADARLVVELDGYYHFRDAEAYRRDRRKDALLQEHGWFVLRFLAEDVVGDPCGVVARIEQSLARRGAL